MLAAILAVLLLTPFAIYMHLVLKVQTFILETFFGTFYPEIKVADSKSVRCALDTRSNPGIVTLVLTLQGKVDIEEVRRKTCRDILEKKVTSNDGDGCERLAFPYLKKVLAIKYGCYVWKDDLDFDVTNHVTLAPGKWKGQPIKETTLQNYISELCKHPMSDRHSPWQIVLIRLQCSDTMNNQSVLLIRAHHLVSEGLSLKELLHARVLDPAWTPSLNDHKLVFASDSTTKITLKKLMVACVDIMQNIQNKCDPQVPQNDLCSVWLLVRSTVTFVQNVLDDMQKLYEKTDPCNGSGRSGWFRTIIFIYLTPRLLYRSDRVLNISYGYLTKQVLVSMATTPFRFCKWLCTVGATCFNALVAKPRHDKHICTLLKEITSEIGRTVKTVATAPSILVSEMSRHSCHCPLVKRSSSGCKSMSWSEPIPMVALQKVQEASGATINEVLLSLCTGSMTQYFRLNGIEVPKCVLATVPIYSEGFFEAKQTGAEGIVPLSLPTSELDAHGRLMAVRKVLQETRSDSSKYVISAYVLKHVRSFLPDYVISTIVKYLTRHYPILVMNMSLQSKERLSFGGYEVKQLYYVRPPQANLALSLSLMTYNGCVTLVAMSDEDILPQPQVITEQFNKEFNSLSLLLGVRRERHGTTSSSPRITSNFSPFKL